MSSAQPDRSSARHYVLLAVKIAVSIILLTILFSKIDVGQLWQGVRSASFVWLVAAIAATAAFSLHPVAAAPVWPMWLWVGFFGGAAVSAPALLAPGGFGRLLRPLMVFHPEWVGGRIENLTNVLARFRDRPRAL